MASGVDEKQNGKIETELRDEAIELLEMKSKENGKEKEISEREDDEDTEVTLQLQNSSYCTTILLMTIIATVPMINYGLTCLNPTIPVLQEMYNNTYMSRYSEPMPDSTWEMLKALTMSMIVAGSFVGSLSLKSVLMFLSRKQCMIAVHGINILGALIICLGAGLSKAYEPMIIGRFVMGLANGLALGLIPVIIGETCVKSRCAVYDGLIGVLLAIGALFGVILGWSEVFGTPELWPLIIITPAIPSAIYITMSRWITDTPYYIMRNGDRAELMKTMVKLRDGPESAVAAEIRSMMGAQTTRRSESLLENNYDQSTEQKQTSQDITLKTVWTTVEYRRQFVMVLLLFANLMLNGLNNVLFFSDSIFLEAGIKPDYVTVVTVGVFLFQVLSTLPGSYILHHMGSWKLCIIGNIIMIVGHILVVASLATYETVPGMSYLAIVGVAVYLLGFAGGENIGLFPLVSELTTEVTRPICVNFGCAMLWFTGWLVGFMATYFQKWMGAYSFLVWMGFTILFTIYIAVMVPNTKNKTSDEIQQHFKNQ
uniref:solute carrier family 2, facilitated glucose transporter member 5-like n=1 Tax=Styela clava TaxID=7725 RepID=UPI0019398A74|nr:solute carrier family 2, facilitated glucose transporter member 5-like [Styela clava]